MRYKLKSSGRKKIAYTKRRLFINTPIRFLLLNANKFYLAAIAGIFTGLAAGTWSFISSVVSLIFLCLLPIIFASIVFENRNQLDEPEIEAKYSNLFQGLRLLTFTTPRRHIQRLWMYPANFMLRRLIFMLLTVFLFNSPQW